MYLFTRSIRLGRGHLVDSMAWSAAVTEKVNQVTELNVSLWTSVFSPRLGELVWTSTIEDLGVLEASETKLMADSGYLSLVDEGAKFSSDEAIDDGLLQLILADSDEGSAPPQYASVVRAVLAPGYATKGIELGVEIAERVKKITARPTSFGATSTGPYGGIEWFTLYESIEQLQKAQEALGADAEFGKFLDAQVSEAYQTGVTQTIYRKVI